MMRKSVRVVVLFATSLAPLAGLGQSSSDDSLCSLQRKVGEGDHLAVRVAGVLSVGLDQGILSDAACPETTWVELALETKKNRKKLATILDQSRHFEAFAVFEGELYGPPLPDPSLPEAIRKSYRPLWGHLNCCRTKLVVRAILDVGVVPTRQKRGPDAAAN